MTTCNLCGETMPDTEIVDHLRLFHPEQYEEPADEVVNADGEPEGVEIARVTIIRRLTDDDTVDFVEAVDSGGDDLPLTEALGMMRLAEDTIIRERMGGDE